MRAVLGDEVGAFVEALQGARVRGVRANPEKVSPTSIGSLLGVDLEPVPWSPLGFILPVGLTVGGHPAHVAGLVYLQEPSAMSVAEVLAPAPGARVVDLAAAPGGKTTHLSSLVGSEGLVVAVDSAPARLGALHESLDMWGAGNVVTLGSTMEALATSGVEPFDGAVLDPPCTGEGLFRRDAAVARQWSRAAVRGSARRQERMLAHAASLVRPGGVLVYSTCTFEIAENEGQVATLLDDQRGWELETLDVDGGAVPGMVIGTAPTNLTMRLWPHRVTGEGQFVARLRRLEGAVAAPVEGPRPRPRPRPAGGERQTRRAWSEFRDSFLPGFVVADDRVHVRGDRAFLLPRRSPSGLDLRRLTRPGLPLGRSRPGRFQPAPGLATAVTPDQVADTVSWPVDDPRLLAYLRGEPVDDEGPDGWVLVCYEQWGVAWAKRSRAVLKNMTPDHVRARVTAASTRGLDPRSRPDGTPRARHR